MRILPVIDLKSGLVVRGLAGQRDQYRPIESRLAADARPRSIAQAFSQAGFREAYLADLDAIERKRPSLFTAGTTKSGFDFGPLRLIVDAGITSLSEARQLADARPAGQPLAGIIAGLESLASPALLGQLVQFIGPERLIFSLDLKHGRPLTESHAWQNLSPRDIAVLALRQGVRRIIVLDLAQVGRGAGVGTEPLCRDLRALDASLEIIAGGGVRSAADLDSLARAGCDAALVASALHDGRLDPARCAAGWPH